MRGLTGLAARLDPLAGRRIAGLAVSGGPDSLALMLLAAEWRDRQNSPPRFIVYSVDHGLRPEAADEVRFVIAEAQRLGFEGRALRWDGAKPAAGRQAAARAARYRLIGAVMADDGAELLLTGKLVTAEKAAAQGLITAVVPAAEIRAYVAEVAGSLCNEASANSLKVTKKLIGTVLDLPLKEGLLQAATLNAQTREHDDCKRGITAFLNKEKLIW